MKGYTNDCRKVETTEDYCRRLRIQNLGLSSKLRSTIKNLRVIMSVCGNYTAVQAAPRYYPTCSSGTSFIVNLCVFASLSSTYGGAIYISSSGVAFIGGKNFFSGCYATSYGGGIYLQQISASNVSYSCFYSCYASSSGMTLYTTSSSSMKGSVIHTSALFCPKNSEGNYDTFLHQYGTAYSSVNNISSSKLTNHNFMTNWLCIKSDSSFSTIVSGIGNSCYDFNSAVQVTVTSTNFFNNSQLSGVRGLVYDINSSVTFTGCIFKSNTFSALSSNSMSTFTSCFFWNCTFTTAVVEPSTIKLTCLNSWLCPGAVIPSAHFSSEYMAPVASVVNFFLLCCYLND